MRTACRMLLVAVGLGLFASAQAHAQPLGPGFPVDYTESIDSLVANSQLVVVAKLLDFRAKEKADGPDEHQVTIVIEETLKESILSNQPYEKLALDVSYPASVLAGWKNRANRLLVAMPWDCRDEARQTTITELAPDGLAVLTADLKILRDPATVIQAAKEVVRRMPPGVKQLYTFDLAVPRKSVIGTKWEKTYVKDGYLVLTAPVDERLEKRAIDALSSDDLQIREHGVQALRYFKSDENIARLRKLLNDPLWAILHHPLENNGVEVRRYGVREEAYLALKAWGVAVEKPVIDKAITEPDEVTTKVLMGQKIAAKDLQDLARYKKLDTLYLCNSQFEDKSFQELARLENLAALFVDGTNIQDEDLKHLARLKHLRWLSLSNTRITDLGLIELARIKTLTDLELRDTKVTDGGIAELRELRKRLPELSIHYW